MVVFKLVVPVSFPAQKKRAQSTWNAENAVDAHFSSYLFSLAVCFLPVARLEFVLVQEQVVLVIH